MINVWTGAVIGWVLCSVGNGLIRKYEEKKEQERKNFPARWKLFVAELGYKLWEIPDVNLRNTILQHQYEFHQVPEEYRLYHVDASTLQQGDWVMAFIGCGWEPAVYQSKIEGTERWHRVLLNDGEIHETNEFRVKDVW